jgi:C4-dicarboxylate-specific signal transduction histidine kinase
MQAANQIFFSLLALMLVGLYVSTITPAGYKKDKNLVYWQASILLRALSFIVWTVSPYLFGFSLTIANFSFLASMVLLVLLFRSWRLELTRSDLITAAVFLVISMVVYELLRQSDVGFAIRTGYMAIPISILSILEINELSRLLKKDRSFGLKVLLGIVLVSLAITFSVAVYSLVNHTRGVTQLIQFGSTFILWGSLSMHLLVYVAVSSYLSQRLMNRELTARLNLERSSTENAQIKALLEERESLISSLLIANKTAATGALSASIAHELNQPVAAISLNTEFIQRKLNEGQTDQAGLKEVITHIQQDNHRIARIVSTLRDIFRQEEIKTSDIHLDELIEQIKPIILPQVRDLKIDLKFDLNVSQSIPLNSNEISQVIINLLNNSIEALTNANQANKEIQIQTRVFGNYVELKVSDNGPGIPEQLKASIFDLMKTNKKQGMGLGLWLCKHIIDRHQGRISYQPSESGGAEFLIQLPIECIKT